MAQITQNQWKKYISRLRSINDQAANEFRDTVIRNGGYANIDRQKLIDYAYGISTKYGEASAALSAEMYDAIAELSNAAVPAAVPAETAQYSDVAKTVNGVLKRTESDSVLAQEIGKLVKRAGADTMLANAYRDRPKGKGSKRRHSGAQVAWVPMGDTCSYCMMLASKGWVNQTEWGARNHAEHIHANCDCTYAVRFSDDFDIGGYDPDYYKKMYDDAEGSTRNEKMRSMRRDQYAKNKDKINAQKRAAYNNRKLQETLDNLSSFDVTLSYIEKATPGIGNFIEQPGFEDKNGERSIGKWLFNMFGGNVNLLAENREEGQPNPDYLWNNRFWDLKSPLTSNRNTIDLRIRHGISQINERPGGVIIDFSNSGLSFHESIKAVDEFGFKRAKQTTDFIIKKDEAFRVLRVIK